MSESEPAHVSTRASDLFNTQYNHLRSLLVNYNKNLRAMLSPKDTTNKSEGNENDSFNLVSHFESLLFEFQSLLIWEDKNKSAYAITVFTFLFWLVVFVSPPIIPTISSLLFIYVFYEMWVRYLWPEIRVPPTETKENWTSVNPNVLSAPEIENYLAKLKQLLTVLFQKIVDLRQRSHGVFCAISISFFGMIYILGRIIPGAVLVYCCLLILLLTPGFLLHVLPPNMLETLLDYCKDLSTESTDSEQFKESTSKLIDLDLSNRNESNASDREKSATPSPFKSQFYEHFFANENNDSSSTSTSDIADDFEIISDSDLGEVNNK